MSMQQPFVAVSIGSDSGLPVMQSALDVLKISGTRTEVRITSAHRTPDRTQAYAMDADKRDYAVFIAAAGPPCRNSYQFDTQAS